MFDATKTGPAWLVAAVLGLAATPALADPGASCPGRKLIGPNGATIAAPQGMPGNCATAFGDGAVKLSGHPAGVATDTFTSTRYQYDQQGRLTGETYANGLTVDLSGAANAPLTSVVDPLGHTTTFTYDTGHSVNSVTDPLGRTTTYAYDAGDRATAITDTQGRTSTYAYDPGGQMSSTVDGMGRTTTYSYDAAGGLTQSTNPDGATTYTYSAGELTQVHDPLGNTVTYAYDAMNRVVSETDAGAVTGVTTYAYDAMGRVVSENDSLHGVTSFTYDALGRLIQEVDPMGHVIMESWSNGLLQSITDPLGHTTTYSYDALNRLVGETGPDGASQTYGYNGVLEPQTWALMILGFAGVGLGLRRRRVRRLA